MVEHNGSVQPFGDGVLTADEDISWKRKQLIINSKPSSNSYNLVQLKHERGKKAQIETPLPVCTSTETKPTKRFVSTTPSNEPITFHDSLLATQPLTSDKLLQISLSASRSNTLPDYVNISESTGQKSRYDADSGTEDYEN